MTFPRITVDPAICFGKPCIRGYRIPVSRVLELLAAGLSRADILRDFEVLEPEDLDECLRYAATVTDGKVVEPAE